MRNSGVGSAKTIIISASIVIAAVIVLAFSLFGFGSGAPGKITGLSFDPFGSGECIIQAEHVSETAYRLFLPGDTDFSSAKLYFESDSDVRLKFRKIKSGDKCSAIQGGGEYKIYSGSAEYTLSVYVGSDIPSLFISTESGSLDNIHANKENKEKGSIRIVEKGVVTLDTELKSVKGRGNSSWLADKKSYNIKFNEKQSLFGMDPAKKWSLVACTGDAALLKCQLGFELARYMGVNCACEYSPADLYINGEYRGLFLVCESVEIGEGRVDITDLEKLNEEVNPDIDTEKSALCGDAVSETPGSRKWADIPVSPEDITGGYLLEFDGKEAYAEEASAFISPNGQYIVVKSPEYCSEDEINYIGDWYALAEEALIADDGYNSLGKHYSEYFDVDSLARMYIFQEYIQNTDASFSSCFFYKDKGDGKLYAGPAWDFDSSMNLECKIADHSLLTCDRWSVGINVAGSGFSSSVFRSAFKQDDFRDTVNRLWSSLTKNGLYEKTVSLTESVFCRSAASAVSDYVRWENAPSEQNDAGRILKKDDILSFFKKRYAALGRGFSSESAVVFYEPNGGTGFVYSNYISLAGETQKARSEKNGICTFYPPDDTFTFKTWNTERDGSGDTYYPGDDIILNAGKTILYAQWERISE